MITAAYDCRKITQDVEEEWVHMKDTLHEAGITACGDLEWTADVPWMTEEIFLAIAHRSELYALTHSPSLSAREAISIRAEYVEARREANRLCNAARRQFFLQESLTLERAAARQDSKTLFKMAKDLGGRQEKKHNEDAPMKNAEGIVETDPTARAQIHADYLAGVYNTARPRFDP